MDSLQSSRVSSVSPEKEKKEITPGTIFFSLSFGIGIEINLLATIKLKYKVDLINKRKSSGQFLLLSWPEILLLDSA